MKNIIKKSVALLIVMICLVFCFVACDKESNQSSAFLVKDGKTDYKIAVSDNAGAKTLFAVEELNFFLNASTSVNLEVVNADKLEHDKDLKVICLGVNELSRSANVNLTNIPINGFEITTVDNSIYVIGADDAGTLYGVYGLLTQLIDYEVYAHDEVVFNKSDDLALPNLSIKDNPAFEQRMSTCAYVDNSNIYRSRLHQVPFESSEVWLGTHTHNFFSDYVSKDKNEDPLAESQWFSYSTNPALSGASLCLYAQGDEESAERLKQRIVDRMIGKIQTNPIGTEIALAQPDENIWCECESCKADLEKYGTNSATVIKFLNEVSERVVEWMEENMPDRADKIHFTMLGYHKLEEPPVKQNADGSYSPLSEEIRLNKHCGVFLAPLYGDFTNEVENSSVGELVKKWNSVSDMVYMWVYQTNFKHHLYPYNSIVNMQVNYQFYIENGVKFIFDHGQTRPTRQTAFHDFKAWLNAKLQWDPYQDVAQLTTDYFDNMYKTASDAMYKLYMDITNYLTYLENEMALGGSIYQSVHDIKYWPKGVADSFMQSINEAYKAIEFYKETNPELYKKLEERITRESIFPRYVLLDLHSGYYGAEEIKTLRQEFMNDCLRLSIDLVSEWVSIYEGVFKGWGL